MKIAFLGDSRFIGRATAERAVERSLAVTVIHTGKYPGAVRGADHVVASRADSTALQAVLEQVAPDALIDTFAMTREDALRSIESARGRVPRLVLLSSQDVYAQFGRLLGHSFENTEDVVSETSPLTVPYPFRGIHEHKGGENYDKKDVEATFREAAGYFDAITTLRLPATYGSYDKTRRFGWIVDPIDSGLRKLPHIGGASWRWTHGHVTDVADAILLAATHPSKGYDVFNVGEPETPTVRERVELIAKRMGVDIQWAETLELSDEQSFLGPKPNDFVVSTQRIRDKLGYLESTTSERRIDDLIAWLRASR